MSDITEKALLRALQAAAGPKDSGSGLRVVEIAAAMKRSENYVRTLLTEGLKNGTVGRTQRMVERLDGRQTPVTAYYWKGKK